MSTKGDAGNGDDGLPDDFFDDFSNADFIDGLNVVDAWDDKQAKWNDDDLRDLLRNRKEEAAREDRPVHRRDVSKTQRDILKDKEAKVREHIAKRLDSPAGPPGTELDDFEEDSRKRRRRSPSPPRDLRRAELNRRRSPLRRRLSPLARLRSPRRRSPLQRRRSPSPRRRSPSPRRRCPSPRRRYRSRSKSPLRRRHSRSPNRRSSSPEYSRRNREAKHPPAPAYSQAQYEQYPSHGFLPAESYYPQTSILAAPAPAYYAGQEYNYPDPSGQMGIPIMAPPMVVPPMYGGVGPPTALTPQPVPAPSAALVSPVPIDPPEASLITAKKPESQSLEQLLKDGKISTEDYLKLKPKGRMDTLDLKEKVNVLSRCNDAIMKLSKLHLPNRLIMSSVPKTVEQKAITPKYCSPLKRQPIVVFKFTSPNNSTQQSNKQLVDSIIATIGLENVIAKPAKKDNFNTKDVSVQTTTPFCESCEIRSLTRSNDRGTSVDRDHFSTSAHTQVIESELASSKTTFTPVGNVPDTSAVSLSHLTPAQLIVSQLAARAKKLELPNNPSGDFEYTRRQDNSYYGGQNYQNSYRY